MDTRKTKKISGNAMKKRATSSEMSKKNLKRCSDGSMKEDRREPQPGPAWLESFCDVKDLDENIDSSLLDKSASHMQKQNEKTVVADQSKRSRVLQPLPINKAGEVEFLNPDVLSNSVARIKYSILTKQSHGIDYTLSLPNELILYVFHFLAKPVLGRCCQVCQRWYKIALDESLWKEVDLSDKCLSFETVDNILSRGISVARMTKIKIEDIPRSMALPVRQLCLRLLDLSSAEMPVETLSQILSNCHHLTKLSLEAGTVNNDVCRHIAANTWLDTLNLALCKGITQAGLAHILSLHRLESLNLAWVGLTPESLHDVAVSLPCSVRHLNISGLRENAVDADIMLLCRRGSELISLDLSDATVMTAAVLQTMATNLVSLQHLALSRCYHINPTNILSLLTLPSLKTLEVFGMFREGMMAHLADQMPELALNSQRFSTIARPTTGRHRSSIWGERPRAPVKP